MSTRVTGLLVLVISVGGCHGSLSDCPGVIDWHDPCCGDFGTYRSADFVCGVTTERECTADAGTCGGGAWHSRVRKTYCSGDSPYCLGRVERGDWSEPTSCGADQICLYAGSCACAPECCGTDLVCPVGRALGQPCICGSHVCDGQCCGAGLACTPGGCGVAGPAEDLGTLGTIAYRTTTPAIAGFSGGPLGELALAADLQGGETLGSVTVPSAGGYLVRFAPDRSLDWLVHLTPGAPTEKPFLAVQIAPNGDLLTAGRGGTLTDAFGVETVVGSTAFLARFSPLGDVLWVRSVSGDPAWIEAKLAAGSDGTAAALVDAPAPLTFAGGASPDLQVWGTTLAVYDLDGNLSWGRDVGSTDQVMVEDDGSVIVGGVDISTGLRTSDMYVARFGAAGTQEMLASWMGLRMRSSTDDGQGGVTAFVDVTGATSLPVGQGLPGMILHVSAAGVADWAAPPPFGILGQWLVRVPGGYLLADWDQNPGGRVQYPTLGPYREYVAAMSPSGEWLWTQVASTQYWDYVGVAAGRIVGVSLDWSRDCHAWAVGFASTAP